VGDGNPDPATQSCQANDGSGKTKFLPTFPASCPYVTSVGGTVNFAPEAAVSFSGGGFSDYFPRPAYQSVAVPGFLKQLPKGTYAGLYNASGRGFPDLSAQSVNYWINYYGQFFPISGTSASTPAVAGLFAKLNDARIQAHQSPIGFANPLLYAGAALGRGFNDITEGNNPGCGTPGFNATKVRLDVAVPRQSC
jgi:tripeptidyl-peptidase-1